MSARWCLQPETSSIWPGLSRSGSRSTPAVREGQFNKDSGHPGRLRREGGGLRWGDWAMCLEEGAAGSPQL